MREKTFTPEPQAKRNAIVNERKNINLNSSNNDDIIEKESSRDSESNLNQENRSETEDATDSLNITNDTSGNDAKESAHEKGIRTPKEEVQLLRYLQSTLKKTAETKNYKTRKKATLNYK